ncbi:aminoglycoside N(3)-acetyltransferase [Aestuariimicrobium ganziense]|uniref:aminoglycoside N(3)-acetyltransferase n=1 Tax=Aestuariimicrobium ganziense TaxID=2773677 RepID=UPI001940500B|nr:AAC(3) family N-acetyltransferase [Aestuariimicrobium ganziense]
MAEADVVAATDTPRTRTSIADDLRRLGLSAGDVVVLHSSVSSIGWVAGGVVAVLQAFQDVLTEAGTLVVPTHTSDRTDPQHWQAPPVPAEWVPVIRDEVPAFDPALTPTRAMGILPETFRTWPGVRRSSHPHNSFAAWGRQADEITRDHALAWSMGPESPLDRARNLGARVVLMGTRRCTILHLAEVLADVCEQQTQGAAVLVEGERRWVTFPEWVHSDGGFHDILDEHCARHGITPGLVGNASTLVLDASTLVDEAVVHLRTHRGRP